jgi:hypothetical protein
MDSNDEMMMAQLMQDEANAATMTILACLIHLK